MRNLMITAGLACALLAAGCGKQSKAQRALVGRWTPEGQVAGGTVEFTSGGRVKAYPPARGLGHPLAFVNRMGQVPVDSQFVEGRVDLTYKWPTADQIVVKSDYSRVIQSVGKDAVGRFGAEYADWYTVRVEGDALTLMTEGGKEIRLRREK